MSVKTKMLEKFSHRSILALKRPMTAEQCYDALLAYREPEPVIIDVEVDVEVVVIEVGEHEVAS